MSSGLTPIVPSEPWAPVNEAVRIAVSPTVGVGQGFAQEVHEDAVLEFVGLHRLLVICRGKQRTQIMPSFRLVVANGSGMAASEDDQLGPGPAFGE